MKTPVQRTFRLVLLYLFSPTAVLTSAFNPGTALAATYYVATIGNNSNPGTDTQPFRTITYAYSRANAGDTVIVKPGTYTEFPGLTLNRSGTATSPIILRSQIKWQAVLDGQNAPGHDDGILFWANYNVVDGFEIKNSYREGITVYGDFNQVLNNNIHHNGNVANTGYGQDGIFSSENHRGNLYARNYVHHNGRGGGSLLDHGMYLCGDDETAINNIVAFNTSWGFHLAGYTTVTNMKILNNVSAWNGQGGAILWQNFSGLQFKNNIFYKNGTYGIDTFAAHGSGVVIDNNIFYQNPSGNINMIRDGSDVSYTETRSLTTNPIFVNDTSDFHLQGASPAISAGLTLVEVTTDFDAVTRPQGGAYDIGAYEFFQATQLASPINLTVAP